MLPKAFLLFMLPIAGLAVLRPDAFEALLGLAGHRAQQVATATPAALPAGGNGGYPAKRLYRRPRRPCAGARPFRRPRLRRDGRHRRDHRRADLGTGLDLGLVRPGMTMDAPMQTANGRVMGKRVTIPRLEVEGLAVASVDAVVLPQGALAVNLLGMSYLSRLRRFEFARTPCFWSNSRPPAGGHSAGHRP
jgi:aspartyl protease family protein